ncbi:capsid protein [Plant associated genomovirus 2]|uniref:Capsid protein n=1 Tax=Plant associated genomovirus 2 TaxID=2584391 RepID=A0A4Y5QCZ0_9VIRU|nr:capsid protein [Plant associated genomovirus 2]QCX29352.1 capsid protein [Plant associated genomovirus 2]
MAYRKSGTRAARRPTRRTNRRRYSAKKNYSRPTKKMIRRVTSRRRLLNITSQKKRDNMMPVITDWKGEAPISGPATLNGSGRTTMIWCATQRDRATPPYVDNPESARTSKSIFLRGLREFSILRTSSPDAWRWRRIVFTVKGLGAYMPADARFSVETNVQGWSRALTDFSGVASTPARNAMEALIFAGDAGKDWASVFTAKVDRTRVTPLLDKTRILRTGNQQGSYFKNKMWLPVNKSLVYVDEESGNNMLEASLSTLGRPGIGDIYVVDLFDCSTGNSASTLLFEPEATLYWHER